MNKWMISAIGALLAGATLLGCQPNDPPLTTPPRLPPPPMNWKTTETDANVKEVMLDNRVDILLVVDDSRSMKAHQENMSRNINQFIDGFARNKGIDFHIGFTHVWDRLRYGPIVPATCGAQTSTPGRVNWEPPGTLKPFIGPVNELPKDGRRYLTRDDDFRTLLRQTLDPNQNVSLIKDYVDPDPKNPSICAEGPEFEESSTPILGALEDVTLSQGANKGFRRDGALFVAVIFSDAKDEHLTYSDHVPTDPSLPEGVSAANLAPITVSDFIQKIARDTKDGFGGKRRFRIFSVVISPGTKIGDSPSQGACLPDPAFADGQCIGGQDKGCPAAKGRTHYFWPHSRLVKDGENPLVDVARATEDNLTPKEGQVLSICSQNYGADLARYGFQIQQDVMSDVTMVLPRHIQLTTDPKKKLRVLLGDTELTEHTQWNYNPQNNSVIVYANQIDWSKYAGQQVRVFYTPVDDSMKTTKPAM